MIDLINAFKKELLHTKKSLGQHFLINPHFLNEIVDACDIAPTDNIIEIGPGCGVLTQKLLEKKAALTAVEIDKILTEFLITNLSDYSNFAIINSDATKIDFSEIFTSKKVKIVGNLPYNLSVKILERSLTQIDRIDTMVFMFQKEVADRINAKPNSKIYSSLSLFSSYFCDIKKVRDIGGGNFMPNANVVSTILKFTPRANRELSPTDEIKFFEFLRLAFTQKRKTLKNNLISINKIDELMQTANIKPNARAEELTLHNFISLFKLI